MEAGDQDALNALRDEWDGLLARCERATLYQSWEWNEAWWQTFQRGKRLRLLLAYEGARASPARKRGPLIGLAPLYVSRHLGTPLRRLAFLGTGAADYLDVLAPEERAPQVCAGFLRHLLSARGYDLADLQQLRPDSLLGETAACWPGAAPEQRQMALLTQEPCPHVALPTTWAEATARLGKKMRSNLSYYDRLLPKTFENVEVRLAEPDELPDAMTALFDLHQKRWNARLLPGVLGGERVQQFHRRVAERFQARGWLRLHLTRVEGRTVAALYCFRFRERYYYYLGGFAPDLARYSLGTVLTAHAMRQAIAEGCTEFDFLRGNEPYKYRWLPTERINHRLLLSRPRHPGSHAMLHLNRFERYVEHRAKAFAEKQGRKRG